ncbi:MAG: hypothetical protein LLF75_07335 [Eubacteriales bacterium]|nr:hypothetical protein [Eubacteriales bacterium]
MKSVILYYTFGGSTKKEAERIGAELEAPVYRVREKRNRSLLGSFIPGGFQAMKRKRVKILPPEADLSAFERIYIGCPVWAAYPAPAFNSIADLLPAGKEVEVFLCSGGNDPRPSDEGTKRMIEAKGCSVTSIYTIPTGVAPSKLKE